MSAIAGLWNFDGRPDAGESCRRMLAALRPYGPDDTRHWSAGDVALGRNLYRRLPEDRHDRQPVTNEALGLTLVADVRLDNREELAAAAEADASRLSDAALLMECLVRWREGALDRLVGDYAFALWDSKARRLLLARDPTGQRPLYYHRGKTFLAFATMPKGLHALADVPYALDEQAMTEFVALLPGSSERSLFEGVAPVPSGHVVAFDPSGRNIRRYWNPSPPRSGSPRKDYAEGLRHHLDQAVRSQLRGGEPGVATQLSSGYDSAAVTATAARLLAGEGRRLTAFTAVPREGYDGPVPSTRIGDEGPLAAATAALYPNVEHVLIRASHASPLDALDRDFFLFEKPLLNLCNRTWVHAISDAARERGARIMLTGLMGNVGLSYHGFEFLPELLRRGRLLRLAREAGLLVARKGAGWKTVVAQAVGPFLPPKLWSGINSLYGRGQTLHDYSAIREDRVAAMALPQLAAERGLDFAYRPRKNAFATRLWIIGRSDVGAVGKGVLAGWGLDQRDPTADRRLLEYCLAAPMEAYVRGGRARVLAREALADRLPAVLLDERRKGLQAVDWHEGLTAAREEVAEELRRLKASGPAASILDLPRLDTLVANWPEGGWHRPDTTSAYRLALLRGVAAGHFIRKVSRGND